jgi:hypothetical protein
MARAPPRYAALVPFVSPLDSAWSRRVMPEAYCSHSSCLETLYRYETGPDARQATCPSSHERVISHVSFPKGYEAGRLRAFKGGVSSEFAARASAALAPFRHPRVRAESATSAPTERNRMTRKTVRSTERRRKFSTRSADTRAAAPRLRRHGRAVGHIQVVRSRVARRAALGARTHQPL